MKKAIHILIFWMVSFTILAQCPLDGNLYLNNQQAVDDFLATYDGCDGDTLKGNLKIGQYNGSDISDISGLDFIKVVTGELSIEGTQLTHLNGFEGLTSIGGDFYLGTAGYHCAIYDNPLLTSVEALHNLSHIGGYFYIHGNDNLSSLNGLQQLTSVGEQLSIIAANGLTNLSGLDNLTSVGSFAIGGLLYFEDFFQFCTVGNDALTSLTGLQNLTNITDDFFGIRSNQNLTVCNEPSICNLINNVTNVTVSGNATGCNDASEILQSCTAFPQCPSTDITFNTQQEINDFAINYPNCTQIQGNLQIGRDYYGNAYDSDINDFSSLSQIISIGGNLGIGHIECDLIWFDNSQLTSLSGLENLTTIGGNLRIETNSNLTDLTGLEGLTSIGGRLYIAGSSLTSLNGLNNLVSVQDITLGGLYLSCGNIFIQSPWGNSLLTSLSGLDNLQSLENLSIRYNPNLATCNEPFICSYIENGGSTLISNNASGCNDENEILQSCLSPSQCLPNGIFFATQQDIDDFPVNYPNCTEIVGDVIINDSLTASINNLQGLQQITAIGGNFNVDFCAALNDLTGLENLTNIGGYLRVVHNPAISSFQGLNGLTATGGGFFVRGNPLLTNFNGMENLTDIGNSPMWIFDSQGLNDIGGLSNINASTISDLRIYDNPNLSICNISNVCDYLSDNSTHQISNNAPNCNDSNEILASCITDIESPFVDKISLYPTPASQHINIEIQTKAHSELNYLIYNTLGKIVQSGQIQKQVGALHYSIELSDLSTGIYYLNFIVGDQQVAKNFTVIQR